MSGCERHCACYVEIQQRIEILRRQPPACPAHSGNQEAVLATWSASDSVLRDVWAVADRMGVALEDAMEEGGLTDAGLDALTEWRERLR